MDMPNHSLHTSELISASLHFWWLAFLRCSKDYWWICQQKGQCLDERLVKVWQDFGDVFQYKCLMHWWQVHGSELFDSPQVEMDFHKYLACGMEVLLRKDLVRPRTGMLCLAIPIFLETAQAAAAVAALLKIAYIRGAHYGIDAKYQLTYVDPRTLRKMIPAYQTWVLKLCIDQSAQGDRIHKWGSYEMSKKLKTSPELVTSSQETPKEAKNKRNKMRVSQCRSHRAADEFIANVEIGIFPSKAEVTKMPRWTDKQQMDLDQAEADGQWPPKNWLDLEHNFMLPENEVTLTDPNGDSIARELAILLAMNDLDKPFLRS